MLTWLAVKAWTASMWKSFTSFCKERWELLVGVVVGVLGVLVVTRRGDDGKALEAKGDLIDTIMGSQQEADEKQRAALEKNLDAFLTTNEQAKEDFKDKITGLDEEKKERVKEILTSESPEEEIAAKLKEYLN